MAASPGDLFTAWRARADAAAPLGGLAVARAVWGTLVAVTVACGHEFVFRRKAMPSNNHSFPFALQLALFSRSPFGAGFAG